MQLLPEDMQSKYTSVNPKFFQNKVLRIITKLPRATSIEILLQQTGIETIKHNVRKIALKLYFKSQFSENFQIRQLGQYDPIFYRHKRPGSLLAD
jgi:hypothetical protein